MTAKPCSAPAKSAARAEPAVDVPSSWPRPGDSGETVLRDRPRRIHRQGPPVTDPVVLDPAAIGTRQNAVRSRRRGPRSDRRDAPRRDLSRTGRAVAHHRLRRGETRDRPPWPWSTNTRIPGSSSAPSIWLGRTAKSFLRQLGGEESDARVYERLAGSILFSGRSTGPLRTSSPATGSVNRACGVSGSPATCRSCCCASATSASLELVRSCLKAHAYLAVEGPRPSDLVILNEDFSGYRQAFRTRSCV